MPTIRDVARVCGVSAMTVSAVLNNRPGFASPETKQRVLRIVEEMGYHRNAIAQGLTNRRMNTLGVVMSYEGKLSLTSDRYFSPILDGIFAAAKTNHQRTMVITEDSWEEVEAHLLSYLDGHCDGLIFILPLFPSEVFQPILKRKVPFVVIGEGRSDSFLSVIDLDNVQSAFDAVRVLIEAGHRRIGFLAGNDCLLSTTQREAGYRQALECAGIDVNADMVLPGTYTADSGYERAMRLLCLPARERPTALFCGDDSIAHGAFRAALEIGLCVPKDISLVGINDDRIAAAMGPGLTTIRQPLRLIGEVAVDMILAEIAGEAGAGTKKFLPGELITRGSVAPAPFW